MLEMLRTILVGFVFLASLSSAQESIAAADTARNADWPVIGGNSDVWHYSPLTQINATNVKTLRLAWMAEMPTQDGLVGNPIVVDGVVYQGGSLGRAYANDVRTGKLLWTFAPKIDIGEMRTFASFWSLRFGRGVSVLGDLVYVASGDCRLFAVNRRTGEQVWEVTACDRTQGYGMTAAPRVGGGKVFVGNNCADSGAARGYVDAYDAKTGRQLWRFYTMPGDPTQPFESKAMELASKTWGTDYWSKTHGCVSPWDAMTYDEKLGLLYIGTGGPAPWNPLERARDAGDELFSNSIVAVRADTGEYVWHYQTVQHDGWNFDATMPITIADLPVAGKTRRVVMTAPKNGFFYVLDATTGQFLSANNYTPVNWASHIDPQTGRPVTIPDARYWERPTESTVVSPGPAGAHNWQANAFNPITRLIYMPVMIQPTLMTPNPDSGLGGILNDMYYGLRGDPKWQSAGELVAWDPLTQRARWRVQRQLPQNSGVLSTAGNLVFQGTADGTFDAFAADTGNLLWSFATHGAMMAAPTTVAIDGEQLILVATGNAGATPAGTELTRFTSTPQTRSPSRLLAFKLGGSASVPATVVQAFPQPPLPRPSADLVKAGKVHFEAGLCASCHGTEVESARSSIPDLRLATAQTHAQFPAIVLGARRHQGMPAFPNLSLDQINAIQAYVLDEAWSTYEAQLATRTNPSAH